MLAANSVVSQPGKNLTVKLKKKKKGGKNRPAITKTEPCETFFNWFSPPQVTTLLCCLHLTLECYQMPEDDESMDEAAEEDLEEALEQDLDLGMMLKVDPHHWYQSNVDTLRSRIRSCRTQFFTLPGRL